MRILELLVCGKQHAIPTPCWKQISKQKTPTLSTTIRTSKGAQSPPDSELTVPFQDATLTNLGSSGCFVSTTSFSSSSPVVVKLLSHHLVSSGFLLAAVVHGVDEFVVFGRRHGF
mmetsp:Transcript_10703/g.21994  ORF Transcript_10703/g.21994 Transcript_10703/m.21994 type:complete len:115 (+) Transcript_10703:182-526(+)